MLFDLRPKERDIFPLILGKVILTGAQGKRYGPKITAIVKNMA